MKLEMHKNSLFAVLLRSPWWISAGLALGLFALARVFLPTLYAAFVPLPFAVIAVVAAWQQLRAPSASRIASALEVMRAMPSEDFCAALEAGFRRDGYEVRRVGADFELRRAGRLTLATARRWKAMRTGIEPLRDLHAAGRALDAQDLIYVAAGEVTDNARVFATEKNIQVLSNEFLVKTIGVRALNPKKA